MFKEIGFPTWEKAKRRLDRGLRWTVLGAALLVSGCEATPRSSQSKAAENSAEQLDRRTETKTLSEFDFENSFPVDQAEMNSNAIERITEEIEDFLDEHNSPQKFQDLLESRVTIEVSSDERPTENWKKGNEGLSEARLIILDSLLREIVASYQFSKDLKPEAVKNFQNKTFTKRMPAGTWGAGFTPLTQIINPETGEKFAEEELENLPPEEKTKLYDRARYALIIFELPGIAEKEKQYEDLIEIMAGYNNITLLLDRSESMRDDYGRLSKKFAEAYAKLSGDFTADTTFIVPFEERADLQDYRSIPAAEVQKYLESLRLLGGNELLFTSLQQIVERKIKESSSPKTPRAVLIITDEGIQDFSAAGLKNLIESHEQHKIDMYFALVADNGLITFADQNGLQYELNQFLSKLADSNFYPPGLDEEKKQDWLADQVTQVQVNSQGDLVFKFNRSLLRENAYLHYQQRLAEIQEAYYADKAKIEAQYYEEVAKIEALAYEGKITRAQEKDERRRLHQKGRADERALYQERQRKEKDLFAALQAKRKLLDEVSR